MKRFVSFLIVSMMLLGLLAACGDSAATTAPTSGTGGTSTTAPATGGDTGTTAPATGGGATITGEVLLWHAYTTGGTEETALTQLVDKARAANPEAKIELLQIPFDQIFQKFDTEVAAGEGPDMFLAPNDELGRQARAGLLRPVDDLVKDKLTNIAPLGVEGMTVDGKLYGVPESFKAVALYYNTSTVATPPATTDELLKAVKDGKKIVINQNPYHNFGFFQAFGGKLFDASMKCGLNTGGPEAMQFLKDLKAAGATFVTDGGQGDALFKEGQADMIINGPWALGDYRKALGDKLAVAAMPAGPAGAAGPLTGVDGFYINVNSKNPEGAAALALFLTSAESQKIYTDVAGHVPANTTVEVADPLVKGFAQAASTGVARPQGVELGGFWTPFGDMVTKVMEGVSEPKEALAEACTSMDTTNKK